MVKKVSPSKGKKKLEKHSYSVGRLHCHGQFKGSRAGHASIAESKDLDSLTASLRQAMMLLALELLSNLLQLGVLMRMATASPS